MKPHSLLPKVRIAATAMGGLAAALSIGGLPLAQAADAPLTNYVQTVPGQTFTFDMVAIPGGSVTVGSPESEAGREKTEVAPKQITVKPFWMAKYEIAWPQFLPFVFFPRDEVVRDVDKLEGIVDKDGVSHPTKPYGSVYRERGEKGFPAIGMGQPNAHEYCKWLSKKTGLKFRLPTEEEFEYVCRAGAKTAYFWGDDAAQAKDYGWSKENSNDSTHPLGKLKPNAFGLYDIVGNVAEWTHRASSNAPAVARGGAWSEPVTKMRCAARMIETPEWNELDPQIPQSIWWLSAADFVGFRVVRVLDDEAPATAEAAATTAVAAASNAATVPAAAVDTAKAKALYTKFCAGCHAITGKGDTKLGQKNGARDYTDPKVKATLKDEDMFKAIKDGLEVKGKKVMHPIGDKMTDEEIKAVVAYMKAF